MKVYKIERKVGEIAFPPDKCAGCGRHFKDSDIAVCFDDETGASLAEGWYCQRCAEYAEGEEFADDEIIS